MGTATLLIVILAALTAAVLLAVLGVVSASIRREDRSLNLESHATRAVDKRVRHLTGLRLSAVMPDLPAVPELAQPPQVPADLPAENLAVLATTLAGPLPNPITTRAGDPAPPC